MTSPLFDLTGKVAVITGGAGGIGMGISAGLASAGGIGMGISSGLAGAGASIVLADIDSSKAQIGVNHLRDQGFNASEVTTDVSNEKQVAAMVKSVIEEHGRIDILVNCAGIVVRKAPQEYTREEWDRVMNVNLAGTFLCSREVYPHMVAGGGGKIINIGSMTAIFGHDWVSSYSASKGGVVQFTKSTALAWAKDNIQVNAILPGWIHTPLTIAYRTESPPVRYETIKARIPQGRWGEPEDLAGTAVFLSSPASDYLTGVAIPVDGGYAAA